MALEITHQCREVLGRVQARLRRAGAHVSWVRPENIHLTLVFLGDMAESQIPALCQALDTVAGRMGGFDLGVEGLGFFGSPRSPRVIWAGIIDPSGRLADLHQDLAGQVKALGIALEDRPFHPHLALGRVRSSRGAAALTSALTSVTVEPHGPIPVRAVHLFESRLESSGARYTILHTAILKGDS